MVFEAVHAVHTFWDGPRSGVADWSGSPHIFATVFDELTDDWSNLIPLTPLDDTHFRLYCEDAAIWERWLAAYNAGRTSLDTHPALPEDRRRHNEIHRTLVQGPDVDPEAAIWAQGEFRRAQEPDSPESVARMVGSHHPRAVSWAEPHPWKLLTPAIVLAPEPKPQNPYRLWHRVG